MIVLQIISVILCLVAFLVLWILVAPFVIIIDTVNERYLVKLVTFGSAELLLREDVIKIVIRVLFLRFSIDPFKPRKKKAGIKKEKPGKPAKKKPFFRSLRSGRKFIIQMIRSFRAELEAEVDTGDVITNAYLFPAAVFLNRENIHISVNNSGVNNFRLELRNRMIIVLFILIRYKISRW